MDFMFHRFAFLKKLDAESCDLQLTLFCMVCVCIYGALVCSRVLENKQGKAGLREKLVISI